MLIAAIPVRNAFLWTHELVTSLLDKEEVDELWLFDNGSTDETPEWAHSLAAQDLRLVVSSRPNARLYGMWNEMISRASLMENVNLAILNNDLRLAPFALRNMENSMREFDIAFVDREAPKIPVRELDPVACTWRERTGWAFMLRSGFWRNEAYAIDPGLRIWWGDDDLARRAEARGARLCIVEGLGCFHAVSQTTYPGDMVADTEHDRAYFENIWSV